MNEVTSDDLGKPDKAVIELREILGTLAPGDHIEIWRSGLLFLDLAVANDGSVRRVEPPTRPDDYVDWAHLLAIKALQRLEDGVLGPYVFRASGPPDRHTLDEVAYAIAIELRQLPPENRGRITARSETSKAKAKVQGQCADVAQGHRFLGEILRDLASKLDGRATSEVGDASCLRDAAAVIDIEFPTTSDEMAGSAS